MLNEFIGLFFIEKLYAQFLIGNFIVSFILSGVWFLSGCGTYVEKLSVLLKYLFKIFKKKS